MTIVRIDRREFLRITGVAGAGLILGCRAGESKPGAEESNRFNAFVQIATSGAVTIWVAKSDMGQGVRTALPMIVAEELDADWNTVSIEQADLDPKYGGMGTGGSSSVRTSWRQLRRAGAAARAMLLAAAAKRWKADATSLVTEPGVVVNPASGERIGYGELVDEAVRMKVPRKPAFKDPKAYRIIGTRIDRLDNQDITTGRAAYGIDVRLPGMLYAAVRRPDELGATLAGFDDSNARAIPGFRRAFAIEPNAPANHLWGGVAVVADSTWAAFRARDALEVRWTSGPAANETSEALSAHMASLASRGGKAVRDEGNVDTALSSAAKTIEASYEFPFLAHATMEPMNATARWDGDVLELWSPTQFPDWAAKAIAERYKLDPKTFKIHVTLLGGGFGRRANPDFSMEAAIIAREAGAPVKVQWSREDDMRHDYYRPAAYHRLWGGLDATGAPIAWKHRIVTTSIETFMDPATTNAEHAEIGGADDVPFRIPNLRVEYAAARSGVPRAWWRSVEHSFNAFAVQCFVDEMARAAGRDPLEFRLALLGAPRVIPNPNEHDEDYPFDTGRYRRVLEMAAEKAGWGKPLPNGMSRGIAVHFSFYTYVAEVAEVSVDPRGNVKLHRIVAAVDCGIPVNPDGIEAQIEGGIIYGLTAGMGGRISIRDGRVQEGNFDDYPLLRIGEVPKIEVHIVPSTARPSGTGEPGLPPAMAAVANAILAATGRPVRRLPIRAEDLVAGGVA